MGDGELTLADLAKKIDEQSHFNRNVSSELTLADLAKKLDEQARFTRSVSVICTLAILAVMFYTLTEMFSSLPSAIILHYMANLDKIVKEWQSIEFQQSEIIKNKKQAQSELDKPPATNK